DQLPTLADLFGMFPDLPDPLEEEDIQAERDALAARVAELEAAHGGMMSRRELLLLWSETEGSAVLLLAAVLSNGEALDSYAITPEWWDALNHEAAIAMNAEREEAEDDGAEG
ncbi:MAG TPA: hypothetical protein VFH61_12315, partial [Thermoleophilia bacterium]|nr:hypothetical protein [Thermoleophilia bacterium]